MTNIKPVSVANLPQNNVCHAVVSGEYPKLIAELERIGIIPLPTSACTDIMPQVSYHADMLFSHLGGKRYLLDKSQASLKSMLDNLGFLCEGDLIDLQKEYPLDSILNAAMFDKRLICGKQSEDYFVNYVDEIIEVKQGYSKCSICPVNDNSLITDDASVFKACTAAGFDVLLVSKGSVLLKGFDYGFIGGCCGKIAPDTIAFFGNLKTHYDYQKIESFLIERGVYPLSLSTGSLIDVGSILPITEYRK